MGPTGPAGPELLRLAYLVSFNQVDYPPEGIEVANLQRLPIKRDEMDVNNTVTLDADENTFKFNRPGFYKITILANAYVKLQNKTFNPQTDFITIGFRQTGTDYTYIGNSIMVPFETPTPIMAHGIITVVDTSKSYELANLSPKSIFLSSPSLDDISSISYFTNSLVTIIVEYLGVHKNE